ncbi:MAG TPA: cyclic nucleotide-binding and patatin-like phospholipase domain-containing protein [Pirellulales bacterium]
MSIICDGGETINEASLHVLRRSELCRGLTDLEIGQIAEAVRHVIAPAGEIICQQGDAGGSMYILVAGRAKVIVERDGEEFRLLDYLGRGAHFGEMAVLTDGLRTATVSAVVDSELLELDREQFDRLLGAVPGFAANLSRSLGTRLRWETSRRQRRHEPTVIGLVNSTLRTQGLIRPLAEALIASGDSVEVLTDRPQAWPTAGEYHVERLPATQRGEEKVRALHEQLGGMIECHDRVLVDVTQSGLESELPKLLSPCEEIWWLIEPRFQATSLNNLRKLLDAEPRMAARIRLVWILAEGEQLSASLPPGFEALASDFKVVLGDGNSAPSRHQRLGIERLARRLRGARIGLALGGGGARGMAHLGVLRGLERAGISFDLMAGTSSGALVGLSYAGGWSPQEAIDSFTDALTPPALVRAMPGGNRLYMWTMFRMGAWDRKLRKFLGDARLEHLQIPLSTVAVDLITGRQVIRDRGDAIHAVLESINVPGVSRPILRDGMALVDGGVLNNLPADVLVDRGASFVVGIDVATRMPMKFGGNQPGTPMEQMRRGGALETLFRVNEVQAYGVTAMRHSAVDLMITPDTSAFEFADFCRARELADAGEAAAEAAIPELKRMLSELNRRPA